MAHWHLLPYSWGVSDFWETPGCKDPMLNKKDQQDISQHSKPTPVTHFILPPNESIMPTEMSQSHKENAIYSLCYNIHVKQHSCNIHVKQTISRHINMNIHLFSQINCIMKTSISGSKDVLQYASLFLNKSRTTNATAKYASTIWYKTSHHCQYQ